MPRATRRRKGSHQNSSSTGPLASPASIAPTTATEDFNPSNAHFKQSNHPPQPSPPTEINRIDARPHLEGTTYSLAGAGGTFAKKSTTIFLSVLAQSTVPMWVQTAVMVSLIFGGCCSNVFALEAIVKVEPESGHLITFAQFLVVATEGFFHHFDLKSPFFLKRMKVPLYRWLIQIILFFSVSVLNNYAFGFNVSVPVHIILRSGGSMTTLLIGWVYGKRYSRVQVFSVIILTVGCVTAALGDSKGQSEAEQSVTRFMTGLAILFVAQVLSAFMGLYIEATYAKYDNNNREGLFYTHALSLFLFIPFARSIRLQFTRLLDSKPLPPQPYMPFVVNNIIAMVPRQVLFLILNSLTQYVCIRGVNMLGAISSALTVTIVLNVRKLVSLLLSIWLFGNKLSSGVTVGAMVVFIGGFLYGAESHRQSQFKKNRDRKNK